MLICIYNLALSGSENLISCTEAQGQTISKTFSSSFFGPSAQKETRSMSRESLNPITQQLIFQNSTLKQFKVFEF